MDYFSRFSTFSQFPLPGRKANGTITTSSTTQPDEEVPFIPDCGPDSSLYAIKAYRYRPSKGAWKHALVSGLDLNSPLDHDAESRKPFCSSVRIITWNIDFMSPHAEERMTAALRHIEQEVLRCKEGEPPEPCCILLQEVLGSAVPHLLRDEWVRKWFAVTPFTRDKWPENTVYGNITLIARSLHIAECHILHYGGSKMQRTAVCTKVKLSYPAPSQEKAIISIVNTHLESLPVGAFERPKQLELCSRFLKLEGVHGGVVAGDMNAIGADDATLPKEYGLKDAWRKGEIDAGKTWGYQGQNARGHPHGRLDKVLYLSGVGYKVDEPRRIGVGVTIGEDSGQALWVSDHYGLDTTLRMLRPRSASA